MRIFARAHHVRVRKGMCPRNYRSRGTCQINLSFFVFEHYLARRPKTRTMGCRTTNIFFAHGLRIFSAKKGTRPNLKITRKKNCVFRELNVHSQVGQILNYAHV